MTHCTVYLLPTRMQSGELPRLINLACKLGILVKAPAAATGAAFSTGIERLILGALGSTQVVTKFYSV